MNQQKQTPVTISDKQHFVEGLCNMHYVESNSISQVTEVFHTKAVQILEAGKKEGKILRVVSPHLIVETGPVYPKKYVVVFFTEIDNLQMVRKKTEQVLNETSDTLDQIKNSIDCDHEWGEGGKCIHCKASL